MVSQIDMNSNAVEKRVLIGQLAKKTNTRLSTLLFWLRLGLLKGLFQNRGKGTYRRFYLEKSVERIEDIKVMKENGASIDDIYLKYTGKRLPHCKVHTGNPRPCYRCGERT